MRATKMNVLVASALAAGLLSGCSGGTVDSTESVCDDFAAHARDGLPAEERADVVTSIGEVITNADQGVQDAYPGLEASASAPDATYTVAADTFAQACFDAGWES